MNKKKQIIITAIRLFVDQGFENTPTSQISKEAGVATGTLFHHFQTKEDLINEAYLYVKKRLASHLIEQVNPDDKFKERMKVLWVGGIRWSLEHKKEIDFSFMYGSSVYITRNTREEYEDAFAPFQDFIKSGVKKKILKNLPNELLMSIYAGLFHSILNHAANSKKNPRDLYFDTVWDTIKR